MKTTNSCSKYDRERIIFSSYKKCIQIDNKGTKNPLDSRKFTKEEMLMANKHVGVLKKHF